MDPEISEAVAEAVSTTLLVRGGLTLAVAVVMVAVLTAVKAALTQFARVRKMLLLRVRFVYRLFRVFVVGFAALVVAYVWGMDPQNLWVFITGVVGLVAIGFFAVWSLLSNVVAGVFLFLSDPFKVDDEIEVPDGELAGRVLDIRPLFVVVREPSGHTLYLPNSLLFQKPFRRKDPAVQDKPVPITDSEAEPAGAD